MLINGGDIMSEIPALFTIRQFADCHPAFTEAAIRDLIFRSRPNDKFEPNGLDIAIMRRGRRILIDEAKFFTWLDEQQPKANV